MIDELSKHYRIVAIAPSDETIRQRDQAITELVDSFADRSDNDLACLLDFATSGVLRKSVLHSTAVTSVMTAIHNHQVSFATDLDTGRLDAQVTACLALGRALKMETRRAEQIAYGILCARQLAALPDERFQLELQQDLHNAAKDWIERAGKQLRSRNATFDAIKGTELATIVSSANTAIAGLVESLERLRATDREELNVLWWTQGRRSTTKDVPFSELPPQDAILLAALEVHSLTQPPRLLSGFSVAYGMLDAASEVSIEELISSVSEDVLLSFCKTGTLATCETAPALTPFSYLANRRTQSDNWLADFEQRTKLKPGMKLSSAIAVRQLCCELSFRTAMGDVDVD